MSTISKFKIGSIIRKYRKQNNYTQEELADLVNLTPSFLGQIERDETYPKLDNLAKLIKVLGIDANLIFNPDSPSDAESDLLYHELLIRISKLNKPYQECILTLAKKLEELQQLES